MSAQTDLQDHADAIFAAAAAAVTNTINAEPIGLLNDQPGKKLVDLMVDAIRTAARAEDFSDLGAVDPATV